MIDDAEVRDRLRRTFDAVAQTTRVGAAPRDRMRRLPFSYGNAAAALVVASAAALVLLFGVGRQSPTRVRTGIPADEPTTTPAVIGLHSLPGFTVIASESGGAAGYVRTSYLRMPYAEYQQTVNARTMWPVTDAAGTVVGYIAPDVPFIPLADVRQPDFDIEKVRAAREGGCEEQVGDPNFKQEFPPCGGATQER